jgi:hypothetical protein
MHNCAACFFCAPDSEPLDLARTQAGVCQWESLRRELMRTRPRHAQ